MSLGPVQSSGVPEYQFFVEFPSGFGFGYTTSASVGSANLADFQTAADALRGAGLTVNARRLSDKYQEINTP